jgi:hypothetical protein
MEGETNERIRGGEENSGTIGENSGTGEEGIGDGEEPQGEVST